MKRIRSIALIAAVAAIGTPALVTSGPAPSSPVDVAQPNGEIIRLRFTGDEFYNEARTLDGHLVERNAATGAWEYVTSSGDKLISSGRVVGVDAPPSGKARTQELSEAAKQSIRSENISRLRRPVDPPELGTKTVPNKGASATGRLTPGTQYRPLFVLVDFSPGTHGEKIYTKADFEELFFSEGVIPTGSMKEYYEEVSYGSLDLVGDVVDWTMAPQPYSYYVNANQGRGSFPNNAQKLVIDICNAIDATVDFSQYDGDNDGRVDAVYLIPEGLRGGNDLFWAFQWFLYENAITLDGKEINKFAVTPEQYYDTSRERIGVFCHEYGHVIGLPDLYDTNGSGDGDIALEAWCLMASGSHAGEGNVPNHMMGWSKEQLGFATPTTITSSGTYTVRPLSLFPDVYKINLSLNEQEYLLIENRYAGSGAKFDKFWADNTPLDSGLVITHVDMSMPDGSGLFNDGPPENSHFAVRVEDPGESPGTYPYLTKSDAAFSLEDGQTLIGPDTGVYSTRPYDGSDLGITISNISNSGSSMTFDVTMPEVIQYELIVDNTDPGASTTGSWSTSTFGDNYGIDKFYSTNGTGNATITWTTPIDFDGPYEIFGWVNNSAYTPQAKYTVHAAGGDTPVTASQQSAGGGWSVPLGRHEFTGTASVTLSNESNGIVVGDALRFVYIDIPEPPETNADQHWSLYE